MGPAYRRVNFALRAAKNIERKMMAEAFSRLSDIAPVESYRYVGMGGLYYGDFVLFHRSLGMKKMTSIEREKGDQNRFLFNRPFKCIDVHFGESGETLPLLQWDSKTITWLDYLSRLNASVLSDIAFLSAHSTAGSIVLVTVNSESAKPVGKRLEQLRAEVGASKVPSDIVEDDLAKSGTAKVFRRIVTNEILETLTHRNGALRADQQLKYKQVFFFTYSDGTPMATIGGLICDARIEASASVAWLEALEFFRGGEEPYHIDCPMLTSREVRNLERQLPSTDIAALYAPGISEDEMRAFSRVYRWFPKFTEADL